MARASICARWFIYLALIAALPAATAQAFFPPDSIPPNFRADAEFAKRMRPRLTPHTEAASLHYPVANKVMDTLLQQLPIDAAKFSWTVRIGPDIGNIFSSPDGMILIDQDLAQAMGQRSGLWAAALSHEIAHVIHRDWARRYLFEKSLEGGAGQVYLGEESGGSWLDPRASSMQLAVFSQALEFEADADSLMLMARAGFHPDFAAALHQLMHAQPGQWDGPGGYLPRLRKARSQWSTIQACC
jgi:Zn-dependent protease with chaperone function